MSLKKIIWALSLGTYTNQSIAKYVWVWHCKQISKHIFLLLHCLQTFLNLFVMFVLVVLSIFLSVLSIILLTYYYYFVIIIFFIVILENLITINNIESAKVIGIKPGAESQF